MTRRRPWTAVLTLAVLLAAGGRAKAQWEFPFGFGPFGWGGWGADTVQGSIARGLGAWAMGEGFYNKQTAEANAINADTIMRWNQYVYEAQKEANRIHHERLAQERLRNRQAREQIYQRLRNNPEPADIYRGDAMNVAFDEINDPRIYVKSLEAGKEKLPGDLVRNIPFQYASLAISVSIHQLTRGNPPAGLMRPEFEPERAEFKALAAKIREQLNEEKMPDPALINQALAAIHSAEEKAQNLLPRGTRERNEVDRYLKALHGLVAMLQTPAIDVILSGVEMRPEVTVAQLLNFMNAYNLRFGPATTPPQRMAYDRLYPTLVAMRNEIAPLLASSPGATTSGQEAGEFFSGMSLEDIQKKAPRPPAPQP
jgi:hypothetical protein